MKTSTRWKHDRVFESSQGENKVILDGDKKDGIGPKALLLSGLAGCSGVDIIDILLKQRVGFSDLNIEVEAEQTEEHPKVFKDIFITFSIRTDAANEAKVKKAIDLSLQKYCGVSAMLKKNSSIHYKLELLT